MMTQKQLRQNRRVVPLHPIDYNFARLPEYTVQGTDCGLGCANPEAALAVESLGVTYHGQTVLSDVSLTLNEGCITALIGPSGCGKTTFLSCLNRMIDMVPGSAVTGTVRLYGEDIRNKTMNLQSLRRHVGMVFQRPNPFPFSIYRNFEMPMLQHGIKDRSEIENRMEQALKNVGLWKEISNKLHRPALTLSGGQQQRLCIARAIVLEPNILLMDEPCSALDPNSSAMVEDLIVDMKNRYTVVIVTHNLAQARRISNYVACFWVNNNAGAVIEFGQCDQVFTTPTHTITADYVSGLRG